MILTMQLSPQSLFSVKDDSEIFSRIIQNSPLVSGAEIPFKIKFPEVVGTAPVLLLAEISF